MIINHGMLPCPIEEKSYLFITDKRSRPAAKIAFFQGEAGWQNFDGCKTCTQDKQHRCATIEMDFQNGIQFKSLKGNFVLTGGEWLQGGSKIEKRHYPKFTPPCPDLPVGTELYRAVAPGKWNKQTLLVSGEWQDVKSEFCKKKQTCNNKLPFTPSSGDVLLSADGRLKFEFSFNDGWVLKTAQRTPKGSGLVSKVFDYSGGAAYAH